jgi:type I restriction enzyme S subunit
MRQEATSYNLPDNWAWANVGDVALHINYGYTASSTSNDTGVKFLRITDIQDNHVDWSQVPFCNIHEQDIEKYRLEYGDLVFARTGATVGKSFLISGEIPEAIFASYLIRVKTSKQINAKYFYLFFQSADYWREINSKSAGIGQPNVNASSLSIIKFPIAPLNEQNKIVEKIEELFSELDNSVISLKNAKGQLPIYKQALLKNAFSGKLSQSWRELNDLPSGKQLASEINRVRKEQYNENLAIWQRNLDRWKKTRKGKKPEEPFYSDLHIVKSPDADKLPNGWFYSFFKQAVKNLDGNRIPLSQQIRQKMKGKYPYYGATGILDYIDEYIFDGEYLLIGEDGANLVSKAKDLAFTARGKFWVNNHAHVVRPLYGLNIMYLCYFFNSLNLSDYVSGTAQPKLSQSSLNRIPVPYCSVTEQMIIIQEIESQFSVMENLERVITDGINRIEILKQNFLKMAFSGELTKFHRDEQNATDLLREIKIEKEQYLIQQDQQRKNMPKKIKANPKGRTVFEILKSSKKPISAEIVWQESIHKENIESFYAELKTIRHMIKEIRKGSESLLSLKNENR